jgi:HD-GYP domain-containing protein (c-di-GMP phosphodiesterase class II)
VPLITLWNNQYYSLYAITFLFLGISLWNFPKWYLLIFSSFGLIIHFLVIGKNQSSAAFLVNLFIYLLITYLSYSVTNQFFNIKKLRTELILALSKSLESRDSYTGNHSENVARYALLIAEDLNLSKEQCEAVYAGGLLHDIGKIGIAESILTKPAVLTKEEYDQIKLHPVVGYNTIKHISSIAEIGVFDMVLYHHERYDGKGYPKGLKGEEIPLVARIMCIADAFDAMTTNRSYRDAMDLNYVFNEIENNKGTQFDPKIADIFLNILKKEGANIFLSAQSDSKFSIVFKYKSKKIS